MRNNLTGLDVVDLVGTGATGEIKFGNRKAGSTIHAFEMTEKHLKDCDSKFCLGNSGLLYRVDQKNVSLLQTKTLSMSYSKTTILLDVEI